MKTKSFWYALAVGLVVLELLLTFWQNYQLPLDGDLVPTVLPAPGYSNVLRDPFGWAVLTKKESYAGTNRFFAHATMGLYWKQVPRLLQLFTSPINSLYVASALFTTLSQALILFTLAAYVRLGAGAARSGLNFWVAAGLLAPLFQMTGLYEQMGITNYAITYTFFYAFPVSLLLLLLYPFFRAAWLGEPLRLRLWQAGLLVLLMVVISFNGPIATAAVAVLLAFLGLYWVWLQWRARGGKLAFPVGWFSGQALVLLGILGVLSLYSLYIGRYNSENENTHTLADLYKLLPTGFFRQLTMNSGLPLLIGFIVANAWLIRFLVPVSAERQRVLKSLRWVGLFALAFILLLPFGGYRPYRPLLIRIDSILPVLVGLLFAYGISTYFLLYQLPARVRTGYAAVVAVLTAFFIYADFTLKMPINNDCERWALEQIAESKEPVVHISTYCNLLSWSPIGDYNMSDMQGQMLHYWGVTPTKKQYFQK